MSVPGSSNNPFYGPQGGASAQRGAPQAQAGQQGAQPLLSQPQASVQSVAMNASGGPAQGGGRPEKMPRASLRGRVSDVLNGAAAALAQRVSHSRGYQNL